MNIFENFLALFFEVWNKGFLGIDIPEEYGGLELDKTTSIIVVEALSAGRNASLLVTFSAHTGISTLPIIWTVVYF